MNCMQESPLHTGCSVTLQLLTQTHQFKKISVFFDVDVWLTGEKCTLLMFGEAGLTNLISMLAAHQYFKDDFWVMKMINIFSLSSVTEEHHGNFVGHNTGYRTLHNPGEYCVQNQQLSPSQGIYLPRDSDHRDSSRAAI